MATMTRIAIAHNPIAHARSKQIDIRFHFVRELVERRVILIEYVKTTSMLADGLTKPLPTNPFARFVDTLGLRSVKNDSIIACLAMTSKFDIVASTATSSDIGASTVMSDDIIYQMMASFRASEMFEKRY
jgi:hypothetical protein